jgi:hypothetical protein
MTDGGADTSTGDFYKPAVSHPPIDIDARYNHVLSFMMTPLLPPLMKAIYANGPIVLYSDDMDTIVFSPMDHFYVSLVGFENSQIRYGLEGEVQEIPAGFTQRFIMVKGKGIGATIARWGELLRTDRGVALRDRYADRGLSYLGYWTDNGSYYYYRTEPDKNYQDTLLAVGADAQARGIPFGYMQLDSWWYFKVAGTPPGGLIRWEPRPEMFPDGLASFDNKLGLPLVAHNRYFAIDNGYRDKYPFVNGKTMALPLDRGVFDEFMTNCKAWGIETYEQDWLMSQFLDIPYLRNGVDHAEKWFGDMTSAAADKGLTMQICMAGAAELLDSIDKPAVTTSRTSIDYQPSVSKESFWPQFHTVNMLARAIGILPFKDNFQTSEKHPEPEALISILSAGMVGPSDQVGVADRELLMRTCRQDGLLLKPDVPAIPIDAMFLPHQRPYTTFTHSSREAGKWTYLAAYLLASAHPERTTSDEAFAVFAYDGLPVGDTFVFPKKVTNWKLDLERDLDVPGNVVAYDWRTGKASVVNGTLEMPPIEHLYEYDYFVLAPVLSNGLALIGEPAKYVTMADKRFTSVKADADSISVTLSGVPGEQVVLLAYDTKTSILLPKVTVTIGIDGTATGTVKR